MRVNITKTIFSCRRSHLSANWMKYVWSNFTRDILCDIHLPTNQLHFFHRLDLAPVQVLLKRTDSAIECRLPREKRTKTKKERERKRKQRKKEREKKENRKKKREESNNESNTRQTCKQNVICVFNLHYKCKQPTGRKGVTE